MTIIILLLLWVWGFLDSTYKWDHIVFVFLVTYLAATIFNSRDSARRVKHFFSSFIESSLIRQTYTQVHSFHLLQLDYSRGRVGHDWSNLAAAAEALMASQVAQTVKSSPPMQMWLRSLGWEDPLEEGMATHSSILPWRIPWTEEPGGVQSMGLHRVGHNWVSMPACHANLHPFPSNMKRFLLFGDLP